MSDGKGKSVRKEDDSVKEAGRSASVGDQQAVEPKTFTFKSKYRKDVVRLRAPYKVTHQDGTKTTYPGVFAEFERNTWSTEDPELAEVLRQKIKEREKRNPLGIFETTDL